MTIAEIVDAVRLVAEPWSARNGGTFTVSRNPFHAYELVSAGPRGLIVVLGYGGERVIDSPQGNPLARMRIEVTLGNGMGLTPDTDAIQFRSQAGSPALADLIDDLVQSICAINLSEIDKGTTNHNFLFQGDEPMELQPGIRMSAYRINFDLIRLATASPLPV